MTFNMNPSLKVLVVLVGCVLGADAARKVRVVGGTTSVYDLLPFLAEIVVHRSSHHTSHICGGSLVTYSWVLTAAHCKLDRIKDIEYYVGVGKTRKDYDVLNDGSIMFKNGQTRQVYLFHRHEQYNSTTSLNDIALVQVVAPFDTHPSISLIRLPMEESDLTDKFKICYSAGWGNTASEVIKIFNYTSQEWYYNEIFEPTSTVVLVNLTLISNKQCRRLKHHDYKMWFGVENTEICTLYYPGRKALCRGDSGGPLICGNEQHGISSWSFSCGKARTGADVFTRVDKYLDWINDTMDTIGVIDFRKLLRDSSGGRGTAPTNVLVICAVCFMYQVIQ